MHKVIDAGFQCHRDLLWRWRNLIRQLLRFGAMAGLVAGFGGRPAARADDNPFHKTVGGIEAYFGLVPAVIVRGHPTAHPESTMHGGPPKGRYEYHIVVALFEVSTGERITDAKVNARISGLGLSGADLLLEPMKIAETISYGGYGTFASAGRYDIRVDVARPGSGPVSLSFPYDQP
jgi:hypothetical protein